MAIYSMIIEAKYLTEGQKFKFKNRKTVFEFVKDHRTYYEFKDSKENLYQSDWYNRLVLVQY